jgi:hypothetical protein
MSLGFKVKLSDGSVVGPLDDDALQTWFTQGLIDRDTPVLTPNSRNWRRLGDVVNIESSGGGGGKRSKRARADDDESLAADVGEPTQAWPGARVLAGAFLILGAAAAVVGWLTPHAFRADLQPMPWRELGYGQLLLGLTAIHHAKWSRLFTRIGVCLAGLAIFPVIGLLVAQGVKWDALGVPASAWLMTSGLFFMLSPVLPLSRLLGSIAAFLLGTYGVVHFGFVNAPSLLHFAMR